MRNVHLLPTDKPSRLHEFGGVWLTHKEPTECFRNYNIYITDDSEIKEGDWVLNTNTNTTAKYTGHGSMDWWVKIILTTDQDLIKDGVQAIDDDFLEWFVNNPSCESVEVKNYKFSEYPLNYKIIIPKEEPKQETLSYTEAAKKDERIFNSTMMKQETLEEQPCNYCGKTLREQMKGCNEITCYRQFLSKQELLEEVIENLTTDQIAWRWLDIEENYNSIEDTISFEKGVEIGAKWQAERMYSEEEVIELLQKYRYDLSSGKTANIGDTTKFWFEQFKK